MGHLSLAQLLLLAYFQGPVLSSVGTAVMTVSQVRLLRAQALITMWFLTVVAAPAATAEDPTVPTIPALPPGAARF